MTASLHTENSGSLSDRLKMLHRVRTYWIDGVLEQSLHGLAPLPLSIELLPQAVQYPMDAILLRPDQSHKLLPTTTRIPAAFDQLGGSLLILGEPGSGKTTLLLELAREFILRAEADIHRPMPVVFSLVTWAQSRQALDAWLVQELTRRYQIPITIGKRWVYGSQILPLLDGLDELSDEAAKAGIDQINAFHTKYGMVDIAVSCRTQTYERLQKRLEFSGAIAALPLTDAQVKSCLEQMGQPFKHLLRILKRDTSLRTRLRSPLWLNVAARAFADEAGHDFAKRAQTSLDDNLLLHAYINRNVSMIVRQVGQEFRQ